MHGRGGPPTGGRLAISERKRVERLRMNFVATLSTSCARRSPRSRARSAPCSSAARSTNWDRPSLRLITIAHSTQGRSPRQRHLDHREDRIGDDRLRPGARRGPQTGRAGVEANQYCRGGKGVAFARCARPPAECRPIPTGSPRSSHLLSNASVLGTRTKGPVAIAIPPGARISVAEPRPAFLEAFQDPRVLRSSRRAIHRRPTRREPASAWHRQADRQWRPGGEWRSDSTRGGTVFQCRPAGAWSRRGRLRGRDRSWRKFFTE